LRRLTSWLSSVGSGKFGGARSSVSFNSATKRWLRGTAVVRFERRQRSMKKLPPLHLPPLFSQRDGGQQKHDGRS